MPNANFSEKVHKKNPMESAKSYKQFIAETSIAETASPNSSIPSKAHILIAIRVHFPSCVAYGKNGFVLCIAPERHCPRILHPVSLPKHGTLYQCS